MDDDASLARLPTHVWVHAHLWQCSGKGVPATVVRRGDASSGLVLLKLGRRDVGWRVLSQSRDSDGAVAWLPGLKGATANEADVDAYLERQTRRDPDLWVIEIETRDFWHPFPGNLL